MNNYADADPPKAKPKRRKRRAKRPRGSAACKLCGILVWRVHLDQNGRCGDCVRFGVAEAEARVQARTGESLVDRQCRYPGCAKPARTEGRRSFNNCDDHFNTPRAKAA